MELFERYLNEVGRRLPRRLRADVEAELRSSLEDSLEARREAQPERSDASLAAEVLRQLGPPGELAASYLPAPRHLIGPSLLPAYVQTLKICIGLVAVALFLAIAVGLVGETFGWSVFARRALSFVSSLVDASLSVVGVVTVVFALIERHGEPSVTAAEWDPSTLPPLADPARASRTGRAVGAVLALLALLVLNLYPERFISLMSTDEGVFRIPLFGSGFWQQMPLFNLALGLVVVLNLLVVRDGRWSPLTRWLDFAASLLVLLWLALLLSGQPLADPSLEELMGRGLSESLAVRYRDQILPLLHSGARIGILALAAVVAFAALDELIKALRTLRSS